MVTSNWIFFLFLCLRMACAKIDDHYQQHVAVDCSYTLYPTLCMQTIANAKVPSREESQETDALSALVNRAIYETKLYYINGLR
ncbi:hypothetical protein LIER_23926 [Lithospermum erythrorhizon]|uniref:Pectinesterase inhibitor domain-containing protein n=1 Tax=Lithospermum erythrorhizon TaxID=34254 RepID=A0AAV3R2D2_LITER